MKSFFWKFVICVLPCVLAVWAITHAYFKGGFKKGVDLDGGTILVYEIDVRKTASQQEGEAKTKSEAASRDITETTKILAESLKRRIDPNDLYNVIIRPAGGEGRVEIILPTGGTERAKKAEQNWQNLLKAMQDKYHTGPLEVGRGRILELAERIQMSQSEQIWEKRLFDNKEAWETLKKNARDYWAELDLLLKPKRFDPQTDQEIDNPSFNPKLAEQWEKLAPGSLKQFQTFVERSLANTTERTSDKTVQTWVRKEAWNEMMAKARAEWPALATFKEEMERIPPDATEQLVTFIQAKGNLVAQAALSVFDPLVGPDILAGDKTTSAKIRKFIDDNYGPAAPAIVANVNTFIEQSGQGRDLSVEEVQRIKDLVAKVGNLEFRILANSTDDSKAIEDATKLINSPDAEAKKQIEEAQKKGLPPPAPRGRYTIDLAHGTKSVVTYSWVELGPQERRQLNLDNAAKNEPERNNAWVKASLDRNKAIKLPERGAPASGIGADRYMLQGALFYSRKSEDRNLPEEERRKKEIEYFVLARDPEFKEDEVTRTPTIDGSYLSNAYSGQGQDLRPNVHFTFTNEGGGLFGALTRKNVAEGAGPEGTKKNRHLAIILDGLVMSAPTIQSEIQSQGQITGEFTAKEVDSLVNILRAGRLPATLKPQPVSESTIASTLGEDTIEDGMNAIGIAFLAVLVFMIFYYRFAGIVASVALLANLLLTVGFMVAVQATFTLPGLAGLVLMLGMAVDANVLIYERLREERERGASLAQAIRNGYDHALPTIIDTHLSSIFTAIVLYVVGNDQLKGFAVSLTVGLLISLFTSLYMTRVMFDYWLSKGWLHKLGMLRLFARPNIDFMSIRNYMFALTLIVSILGVGLFIARLPDDLNIDFVGGTAYSAKLVKPISITDLRNLVEDQTRLEKVAVTAIPNTDGRRYQLKFPGIDKAYTVSLANVPEVDANDAKPDERRAGVVKQRADHLPDVSVELYYPKFEAGDSNDSRFFTIRTTEKEVELVAAALDSLLRGPNGEPLLEKVYMKAEPMNENREAKLTFWTKPDGTGPTEGSPVFVKTLLTRELKRQLNLGEKDAIPFGIEVSGEGKESAAGTYHVLKVVFGSELRDDQHEIINKAIRQAQQDYADRPQPDRLENFDSQLATETRFRAMWAVLASWGAIALYLWFRFGNWTFGLAAVLCLVHDLFFTLGAVAICHYIAAIFPHNFLRLEDFKINLTAVAALLTLVGYSVNDTIVVFDRIREVRGKNPDLTPKMINDSINQTLSRTVLASLTTWLVVFVLYVLGGPGVHLFAFVMVVGVLVGTYSSIYIASPLLLMFGEGVHETPRVPDRQTASV